MSNLATHDGGFADDYADDSSDRPGFELALTPDPVEIRRNAGVAALVGVVAAAVAIAWLARAIGSGSVMDWAFVALTSAISIVWLAWFVDSRSPLLVADAFGIRLRLGKEWRGLTWRAIQSVQVQPRRGFLRDGKLVIVAHNEETLLAELSGGARRQAGVSQRLYGAPLALPLGLLTTVEGASGELADALRDLSSASTEIVEVLPETVGAEPVADEVAPRLETDRAERQSFAFDGPGDDAVVDGAAAVASETTQRWDFSDVRTNDDASVAELEPSQTHAGEADDVSEARVVPSPTPEPTRPIRVAARAEIRHLRPSETSDVSLQDAELADSALIDTELSEPDHTDSAATHDVPADDGETAVAGKSRWFARVTPIAREGHPVPELVIDDYAAEPAADPVIGPVLRAARTRLGLDVDSLAERTRIRPHVIEAIEVDDFVPCGGDFYARGHLRTLCRILGVDVTGVMTDYDERYAHAPLDPRRVFEAELATGAYGSIRSTRGGPNWSILLAGVMALILLWSVARLVMNQPPALPQNTPVLNGSGGPNAAVSAIADPIKVTIKTQNVGAQVVVRDAAGKVVFRGPLSMGQTKEIQASPPVRVQSSDGSVTVSLAGRPAQAVGDPGEAGQRTYAGR